MVFPQDMDPLEFERFRLEPASWRQAFLELWRAHGPDPILESTFHPFRDGSNLIAAFGSAWIMKVFPPFLRHQWESEWRVMQHLDGQLDLPIPRFYKAGEEGEWTFIIMSRLPGVTLAKAWPGLSLAEKAAVLTDIGRIMARVHAVPVLKLHDLPPAWSDFFPAQIQKCRARHERLGMPRWFVDGVDDFVKENLAVLPKEFEPVILTGEYTPFNLLVSEGQPVTAISGMIDFGDAMIGYREYDLLGPWLFSCEGRADFVKALLTGYGYTSTVQNEALRRRLFLLQILHRYSDFKAQVRIPSWESLVGNFDELEEILWPMKKA